MNESTIPSFKDSLDEMGMPEILHRMVMAPKMKKMVRGYLNWRRKNPGQGTKGVQQVIKMMGLSPRDGNQLIDTLNKMVAKGQLPKHLALEEVDPLQKKQDAEVLRLKKKHDRQDDRARLKKAMLKNRETIVK